MTAGGATRLYLVVGSFSGDSGGRTRAAFLRAAELAPFYASCTLLTFNHRLNYDELAQSWLDRTHAPPNVRVANFAEYLADELVYAAGERVVFEPGPDLVPREGKTDWERRGEGNVLEQRYVLHEDGSLNYRDEWKDGERVVHVNYDRAGNERVWTTFWPGTRLPRTRQRFTAAGRLFADERVAQDGETSTRVIGGPADTAGEHVAVRELEYRWIASLAEPRDGGTVFMSEARAYDGHVAVLNPHLPPGGTRTIASIHSNHLHPPYDDPQSVWTYNDWALRHAADFSRVVILTDEQRADVERHYGRCRTMVTVGYPVASSGARRRLARRVRDAVHRPPVVVVVTRLVDVKRLDHALRAFAVACTAVPAARFEIWGTGPDRDALEGLAAELGVADRVDFPGFTDDPVATFRRGRLSVSTSQTEGFGLSMLESLTAGTPVVSYDYRYGPRDMISDGRDGRLVRDGDVDALAAAMSDLLAHGTRARIMGLWARRVRWTRSVRRHRRRWRALVEGTLRG